MKKYLAQKYGLFSPEATNLNDIPNISRPVYCDFYSLVRNYK